MQPELDAQCVGIAQEIRHDSDRRADDRRRRGVNRSGKGGRAQPCTSAFSIMQWMPLQPLTVCVTRRSAARLHSV